MRIAQGDRVEPGRRAIPLLLLLLLFLLLAFGGMACSTTYYGAGVPVLGPWPPRDAPGGRLLVEVAGDAESGLGSGGRAEVHRVLSESGFFEPVSDEDEVEPDLVLTIRRGCRDDSGVLHGITQFLSWVTVGQLPSWRAYECWFRATLRDAATGATVQHAAFDYRKTRVESMSPLHYLFDDGRPWMRSRDRGLRSDLIAALQQGRPSLEARMQAEGPPPDSLESSRQRPETDPPSLWVADLVRTEGARVEITGRIRDASDVVDFRVDGQSVPFHPEHGFRFQRGVEVGTTELTLEATDRWGNTARRTVTVVRVGPDEPGGAPAPVVSLPPLEYGSYHALIVGNDSYAHYDRLTTARNDATALATLLRDHYGFSVRLLKDATREQLLDELSRYRRTLGEDDNLLLYYAGHGWNDEAADEAYWLPVDATPEESTAWISNATITQQVRAMRAKHVLVVADSCYAGTLTRSGRGITVAANAPDYLERLVQRRSRTALSSGGDEPVADRGANGHSVFANALLEVLRSNQGVIDGSELYGRVRDPVRRSPPHTPQYGAIRGARHEDGEFLFVRRR